MRKIFPAILIISTLVALILFCACTMLSSENQSSHQNPPKETGIRIQSTEMVESPYIDFDEVLSNLPVIPSENGTTSSSIRLVYSVAGIDVDESGDARSWIFGVRDSTGTKMLACDRNGWIALPWNSSQDLDLLPIDSIISPRHLFSQNAAVMTGESSPAVSDRRDLELERGVYTVTIMSDNNTRILTFNATTGELITRS